MTENKSIKIEGQSIGSGHPPYIIAEMSANHNGELEKAKKIIEMTKSMGADAIKLQTYRADTITSGSSDISFHSVNLDNVKNIIHPGEKFQLKL